MRVFYVYSTYRYFKVFSYGSESSQIYKKHANTDYTLVAGCGAVIKPGPPKTVVLVDPAPFACQVLAFKELQELSPSVLAVANSMYFLPGFMFYIPSVYHLYLQNVDFNFGSNFPFLDMLMWCFPSLCALDITAPHVEGMFFLSHPVFNGIRSLVVRNSHAISALMLNHIINNFPGLEELAIVKSNLKNGHTLRDSFINLLTTQIRRIYLDVTPIDSGDAMILINAIYSKQTTLRVYANAKSILATNGNSLENEGKSGLKMLGDVALFEHKEDWVIYNGYGYYGQSLDPLLVYQELVGRRVDFK